MASAAGSRPLVRRPGRASELGGGRLVLYQVAVSNPFGGVAGGLTSTSTGGVVRMPRSPSAGLQHLLQPRAPLLSLGEPASVIADNDPAEQEKIIEFNSLPANCVVFHAALDMTDVVRQPVAEGREVTAERLSPCITDAHQPVRDLPHRSTPPTTWPWSPR